jgi:hypothetical protein
MGAAGFAKASSRNREATVLSTGDLSLGGVAAPSGVGKVVAVMFGCRMGSDWNGD